MEFKKGDQVVVNDPGLLMLQQFAPPGARPNNVGWFEEYTDTPGLAIVKFPICDDDPDEHSQIAPYPISQIVKQEWDNSVTE